MTRLLQNGHYEELAFDEDLSARFFKQYLEILDGEKIYFLSGEVESYTRAYEGTLHDRISTKTFMPIAEGLYAAYQSRVRGRVSYVRQLLEMDQFDFTEERSLMLDREDAERPKDGPALQKLWKESLENMLLSEMVRRESLSARAKAQGKADPFRKGPTVKEKVSLWYDRLLKTAEGTDREDIANYFLSSVATAYDPHSEYLSANEMEQFKISVSNELVGIGARLSMNDQGETEVYGIVNGGPADRQGDLKLGDRIIAVSANNNDEWEDILFKPINKVIGHILGEENAPVGLRVNRSVEGRNEDETVEIAIPRGVVTIKDDLATAKIYEYGNEEEGLTKLGVMTIPSFYFDFDNVGSRVSVDVERLLARLKAEGISGLVLDLRDNGGGSLSEVQRLTGFFVGRGPVVQVRSGNGQVRSLNSLHRRPLYSDPLVILTNRGSASATEILAGALQDYNRAVVVGSSSTYGKGTVQKTMDIADFMPVFSDRARTGWLKLTFQKYYRVSGSSVQIKGVIPDLILPDLDDAFEVGEGFQQYALPHDVIHASKGVKSRNRDDLFIPRLKEKSDERVSEEPYFKYLLEDIERNKAVIEKNEISLSRKVRLAELEENEKRRMTRNEERKKRFAEMEAVDRETFQIYRLTLDDLDADELPLVDPSDDSDDYIRRAVDEEADLEEGLDWPSGIDVVKREGLAVLQDLLAATRGEEEVEETQELEEITQ